METIYERCCGLDIHKKTVGACLIVPGPLGRSAKEIRTFGTMTEDLLKLSDWLTANRVTHVAMESTGVYWKPIWNLLEGNFELLLANAQHIKAVPGRKTDVKDCEWIADLLPRGVGGPTYSAHHGLLKGSFVPDLPQRELRELTRYRTSLVRERTSEVNRLQKTLEGANIKLSSVATNTMGKSGRQILEEMLRGSSDAKTLAQLAKGRLREKIGELERALEGCFGAHQRFLVAQQLAHIDFLDDTIEQVSAQVQERMRPFDEELSRLDAVPGVGRRTAEVLVAEIGIEMARFPTPAHLASWAGMCPGNNESAGKRKTARTRKGSPWLRSALVEAAHAAARTKETYLSAQYHRLAARRGKKKAAVAVGHTILVIVYHLLKQGTTYADLGPIYFDQHDRQAVERRLVNRLHRLGYKVTLESLSAA